MSKHKGLSVVEVEVPDPSAEVALQEAIQTILRVEDALEVIRKEQQMRIADLGNRRIKGRSRRRIEATVVAYSNCVIRLEDALEGDGERE